MGLWALVVVVFFSQPRSKLVGYALPALPPLAFLIAEVVASRAMRLTAAVAAVACVGIVTGIGIAAPRSVKPAVAFVRAQMAPHDGVLMLDRYVYDLAFYLRRADPVPVAADWVGPSVDDWRHELLDAAAFDPESARHVLLPSGHLPAPPCGAGATWIFADPDAAQRYRWLGQAVYSDGHIAVWRWAAGTAAPAGCR